MKSSLILLPLLLTLLACNGGGGGGGGTPAPGPTTQDPQTGIVYMDKQQNGEFHLLVSNLKDISNPKLVAIPLNQNYMVSGKHVAFVATTGGKNEVFAYNIETDTTTQLQSVNDAGTNYTPAIVGFIDGLLIIKTRMSGLNEERLYIRSIDGSHVPQNGSNWNTWQLMPGFNSATQVGSASFLKQDGALVGFVTGSNGTSKMMVIVRQDSNGWFYYGKCAPRGCDSSFNGLGYVEELGGPIYVSQGGVFDNTIALRDSSGAAIVNLTTVNEITNMAEKSDGSVYFIRSTGVVRLNGNSLVVEHSHANVTNLMTDGSRLVYQATYSGNMGVMHVDGSALGVATATKASMQNGDIYYAEGSRFLVFRSGMANAEEMTNLHVAPASAKASFGVVIDDKMYYPNYLSANLATLNSYDLDSQVSEEILDRLGQPVTNEVLSVVKFNY